MDRAGEGKTARGRIRVAVNAWFLNAPSTGTGQYLFNLVRAFTGNKFESEVELCLVAPATLSAFPGKTKVARPVLDKLNHDLAKVEFEHLTYPRISRRDEFCIGHVPHFGPPIRQTVPTVVTIHDLIPMVVPQYRGSVFVQMYTRLAAAGARRARFIIADSEASRRDIVDRLAIPESKIRVIPLAAGAPYRPVRDVAARARARARYRLPEQFVLYLGGFDVRKNVRTLVDAFAGIEAKAKAGWKLVFAGDLPRSGSRLFVDPRIGAGPSVQFIGKVEEDDKPALYSLAGAFAFPSRYEGFGLPPLEAMACGTPVISSNASSLPEVVGTAAIQLDPNDVKSWSSALGEVLSRAEFRAELAERGLARSKGFSWERTARETLDVYRAAQSFGE